MLSIGLPHGFDGLKAINTINETVGFIAPSIAFDEGRVARLTFEGDVRWCTYLRLREQPQGRAVEYFGAWAHPDGPTRMWVEVVGPMLCEPDTPLLKKMLFKLVGESEAGGAPALTDENLRPVIAYLPEGALYEASLNEALSRGRVVVTVQFALLVKSATVAARVDDLPTEPQVIAGAATRPPTFPMVFPQGMVSNPAAIARSGPQTDVVVRGTLEAVEFRQNDLGDLLRREAADVAWPDTTGKFVYLRIRADPDTVFDAACRPEDLVGDPLVGSVIHLTADVSAQLVTEKEKEATAWVQVKDDDWDPVQLNATMSADRMRPPLGLEGGGPSPATPSPPISNLRPILGVLFSVVAVVLLFLPTPFSLYYNARLMLDRRGRVSGIGRVIAGFGVLISLLGLIALISIVYQARSSN